MIVKKRFHDSENSEQFFPNFQKFVSRHRLDGKKMKIICDTFCNKHKKIAQMSLKRYNELSWNMPYEKIVQIKVALKIVALCNDVKLDAATQKFCF